MFYEQKEYAIRSTRQANGSWDKPLRREGFFLQRAAKQNTERWSDRTSENETNEDNKGTGEPFEGVEQLNKHMNISAEVSWKPADNANWFAFVVRGMTKSAHEKGRGRLESAPSCKNKSQRKGFDKESGE